MIELNAKTFLSSNSQLVTELSDGVRLVRQLTRNELEQVKRACIVRVDENTNLAAVLADSVAMAQAMEQATNPARKPPAMAQRASIVEIGTRVIIPERP